MSIASAAGYTSVIPNEVCQKYGVDCGKSQAKPQITSQKPTQDVVEIKGKEKKKNKFAQTAVLLLGGAVIGYCCRKPIGNVINTITEKCGKFFSQVKPEECLQKAKSLIFRKK